MLKNNGKLKMENGKLSIFSFPFSITPKRAYCLLLTAFFLLFAGCRYDMQDNPRYENYEKSDFFADGRASRDLPEGTVARGQLREDKTFYSGKIATPNANVQVETTTDASGNTLVSSFPNDIDEFPMPMTKEIIDRGQDRYNIYCIVCHGPVGSGDGMIVRRGFSKPPTYHDDRLRNAPVGHFFDVMTNGWGKMNSYADKLDAADRWAVVAYIRALQLSQNPDMTTRLNVGQSAAATPTPATSGGTR
ncbi:MAG: cytochrome c [Acidobacteria bacterium]|nr:cytochrome c [Acidobacteriota bacterium]MCA1608477.1 cytochrome c [Acidobacteriota bacterium]